MVVKKSWVRFQPIPVCVEFACSPRPCTASLRVLRLLPMVQDVYEFNWQL